LCLFFKFFFVVGRKNLTCPLAKKRKERKKEGRRGEGGGCRAGYCSSGLVLGLQPRRGGRKERAGKDEKKTL